MKTLNLVLIVCFLFVANTSLAMDYAFGIRWNHCQFTGDGEFWGNYVSGKSFDEGRYDGSNWISRKVLASSAQAEDFSNFNPIPAMQFSLQHKKFRFLSDLEYYQSTQVRITEYTMQPEKKNSPSVYDYEEEARLLLLSFKETCQYLITHEKGALIVGAGIGIYRYSFDDTLRYTEYEFAQNAYTARQQNAYNLSDADIGYGIHALVGYDHEIDAHWHPFISLSYQYALSTFDSPKLSADPYSRVPSTPSKPQNPKIDDTYATFHGSIKDSYQISFSALQINFGISYWL